jgi:chromosome segregation ATPase
LVGAIEEKDEEIKDLRQQASAGERMAAKIEEVYQEFDQLQTKMAVLEKQAGRANNLAIELEDMKFSYEQVHKELLRKQEKLEDIMDENQRMRQQKDELEDKLSEANLQRQQLQKKVMFLTDLNNDMQSISDTNKKLQTEMRRIGELESMLNMMAEERDFLLRKKMDK